MTAQQESGARLAALSVLGAVLDERQALGEIPPAHSGLADRDRAFSMHLAYGVLRWLNALEWLARQLISRPLKQRDRDIHRLVLLGLFQLWQDRTPEHAAVHATAEVARQLGKTWGVGLVNAVLRRFLREQEDLLAGLAQAPEKYAHPEWLLEQLKQDWPDAWQSIADQNNQTAPLWLRVNRQRSDLETMRGLLEASGFATRLHAQAPDAISIAPAVPVLQIPGFADGRVSVQDAAAQLAVELLDPQAGNRVLDACAAPGGKASHLLERQVDISLLALDRADRRCALIRANMERLGLRGEVRAADAGQPEHWWDQRHFDRILLDAPCSATGVIRRHPEIKWLREPGQVCSAVTDQQRLLDQLWPLLDTGGILVYATCSVLRCENHEQIHGFLSRHPDAAPDFPGRAGEVDRQILPGQDGMDGFYYAVLRKRA
jgi:16S rRNA (cytosine967-C5)-methyltransferase